MKKNLFFGVLAMASLVTALTSCEPVIDAHPLDDGQLASFRASYLQTYDLEKVVGLESRSVAPVLTRVPSHDQNIQPRATVPVLNEDRAFVSGSVMDYPEAAMVTSWTVSLESGTLGATDAVYRIVSTTTYPSSNPLVDSYIEEYFVKDIVPVGESAGTWNEHDPIVDDAGTQDQAYRVRMEIHFDDGSVRYEKIVKLYAEMEGFLPFDVDGSLSYPEFSYPEIDITSKFSSIVVYKQDVADSHDYWFWEGDVTGHLLGVRYYTEHLVGSDYIGSMVSYERAVQTFSTWGGDMADQLLDVFVGSEHVTLIESVIRKEVVFDYDDTEGKPGAARTGRAYMKSHVVDTTGAGADFLIGLLNTDEAVFADWDSAPYFIPSGDTADEIVYGNPDSEVARIDYIGSSDGVQIPLLDDALPADTDLASMYMSIITGVWNALLVDPDMDITVADLPGSGEKQTILMPEVGVAEFDGEHGYAVTNPTAADPAINPTSAGTVEAWVYVEKHMDTAGIVHKGVEHDFSDEGYTLQFMGYATPAFGIVQDGTNADYVMAKANLALNTGKWYYLVGTWDATSVKLHIFYQNKGRTTSKTYTKTNTGEVPYTPSGPLVIGSQYLEGYGVNGYFGFDGKINGVVVSTYAKTVDALEDFYNSNQVKTSGW